MILLLCFAFTGQTMASIVMSYHMVSMKGMSGQVQPNNMSMMDHSSHSMASDASSGDTEKSSEDCCDNTCNCFTGGCSSVAVLIKGIGNNSIADLSPKISSVSSLALSQRLTSLYRPPILS